MTTDDLRYHRSMRPSLGQRPILHVTNHLCQCEHDAHYYSDRKTPLGNPGHDHRVRWHSLVSVHTDYGTYKVCPDCARDCFSYITGKEVT